MKWAAIRSSDSRVRGVLFAKAKKMERNADMSLGFINLYGTKSDKIAQVEKNVHIAHCNQGEYLGICKYGDLECPALKKSK